MCVYMVYILEERIFTLNLLLHGKIKSICYVYKKAFVFGIGCWNRLDRTLFHTNEQKFCEMENGSVP